MSDEEKIQALRDAQDNWYIDNWSSFGEDQEAQALIEAVKAEL